MVIDARTVLFGLAAVAFFAGVMFAPARVNLVALGLLFLTVAFLLTGRP